MTRVAVDNLVCGAGRLRCICYLFRAEQSQRDSQHAQTLLAHAFAGSPSAMSLSRLDDTTVVDVNPAYLETLGVAREQIVGRTLDQAGIAVLDGDRRALF